MRRRHKLYMSTDDLLMIQTQSDSDILVLPSSLIADALRIAHDHESSLHPGVDRTMTILKDRVWWPTMQNDVEEYIRTCTTCLKKDRSPAVNVPTLGRTTTNEYPPLTVWSADILSFAQPSGKNKCVVTLMDYATRWVEAYKLPNEQAPTVISALRERFVPMWGYCRRITTDNGQNFVSNLFQRVCRELNYDHRLTKPYSPQANPVERAHRSFNNNLRILLENQPLSAWGKELNKALWAYRSTPTTTGPAPFELVTHCPPTLPIDMFVGKAPVPGVTLNSARGRDDPGNDPNTSEDNLEVIPTEINALGNDKLLQGLANMNRKLHERRVDQKVARLQARRDPSKFPPNDCRHRITEKIEEDKRRKLLRHQQNERAQIQRFRTKYGRNRKPTIFRRKDKVLLWRPIDFKDLKRGRKYARHWSGPYIVEHHDWKMPYRVVISDPSGRWTKDVHINHIKHFGNDRPMDRRWSPFAPPLEEKMIRSGYTEAWKNKEFQGNQHLSSKRLEQANEVPLIYDMDNEDITALFHQHFPNGFVQPPEPRRPKNREQDEPKPSTSQQHEDDEEMTLEPPPVWRERSSSVSSSSSSSSSSSDSSDSSESSESSSPSSSSSSSESDSEFESAPSESENKDTSMATPPRVSRGIKRQRSPRERTPTTVPTTPKAKRQK